MAAETLPAVVDRHRAAARAARVGLRELGLRLWVDDDAAASIVTTFLPPAGRTVTDLVDAVRSAGGRFVTAAPGPPADRVLRLNHTGAAAQLTSVTDELAIMDRVLNGRA